MSSDMLAHTRTPKKSFNRVSMWCLSKDRNRGKGGGGFPWIARWLKSFITHSPSACEPRRRQRRSSILSFFFLIICCLSQKMLCRCRRSNKVPVCQHQPGLRWVESKCSFVGREWRQPEESLRKSYRLKTTSQRLVYIRMMGEKIQIKKKGWYIYI